jgi:hypothetical protein
MGTIVGMAAEATEAPAASVEHMGAAEAPAAEKVAAEATEAPAAKPAHKRTAAAKAKAENEED